MVLHTETSFQIIMRPVQTTHPPTPYPEVEVVEGDSYLFRKYFSFLKKLHACFHSLHFLVGRERQKYFSPSTILVLILHK